LHIVYNGPDRGDLTGTLYRIDTNTVESVAFAPLPDDYFVPPIPRDGTRVDDQVRAASYVVLSRDLGNPFDKTLEYAIRTGEINQDALLERRKGHSVFSFRVLLDLVLVGVILGSLGAGVVMAKRLVHSRL
jgi:hypothetical protein